MDQVLFPNTVSPVQPVSISTIGSILPSAMDDSVVGSADNKSELSWIEHLRCIEEADTKVEQEKQKTNEAVERCALLDSAQKLDRETFKSRQSRTLSIMNEAAAKSESIQLKMKALNAILVQVNEMFLPDILKAEESKSPISHSSQKSGFNRLRGILFFLRKVKDHISEVRFRKVGTTEEGYLCIFKDIVPFNCVTIHGLLLAAKKELDLDDPPLIMNTRGVAKNLKDAMIHVEEGIKVYYQANCYCLEIIGAHFTYWQILKQKFSKQFPDECNKGLLQ